MLDTSAMNEGHMNIFWWLVGLVSLMVPMFFLTLKYLKARKRELDRLNKKNEKKTFVRFKTVNLDSGEEIENKQVLSQKNTRKKR